MSVWASGKYEAFWTLSPRPTPRTLPEPTAIVAWVPWCRLWWNRRRGEEPGEPLLLVGIDGDHRQAGDRDHRPHWGQGARANACPEQQAADREREDGGGAKIGLAGDQQRREANHEQVGISPLRVRTRFDRDASRAP